MGIIYAIVHAMNATLSASLASIVPEFRCLNVSICTIESECTLVCNDFEK